MLNFSLNVSNAYEGSLVCDRPWLAHIVMWSGLCVWVYVVNVCCYSYMQSKNLQDSAAMPETQLLPMPTAISGVCVSDSDYACVLCFCTCLLLCPCLCLRLCRCRCRCLCLCLLVIIPCAVLLAKYFLFSILYFM